MIQSPPSRWHRIAALLLDDKANAIRAALLLIAQGIAAAVAPWVLGRAVDSAATSAVSSLVLIGMVYLSIELIRIISAKLQAVAFSKIGQGAVHRLRLEAFNHVVSLPWSTIRSIGPSDLLSRLTVDIRSASALFEACFLRIIERICGVSAIFIGIISLSVPVGIAVVALLPLLLLGAWYTSRRLYDAFYERQAAFSGVTTSIADSIELSAEIKVLGLAPKRIAHFSAESERLAAVQKIPQLLFGQLHAAMSILSAIAIGMTLVLGQRYITQGLLTRGELVTLIAYIGSIMWPLIIIIDQWSVLLQGLASVDRIHEVLSLLPEESPLSPQEANAEPETKQSAITFDNVTFRYPDTDRGIENLSFSIKEGERVGIVGATGSGKSTISRLLLGLVPANEGIITIQGVPITAMPRENLRETVAFMPQHPEMFSGSPIENITLWDTKSERFAPMLSAVPATLTDLCTSDNDAVTSLSVGEQQCIAALRVFVRNPAIVVLDEPTAAIDPTLEQWLMDTVFTSAPERTYLIIAHRLATLERCDRIFIMEDGRLIGEGRHDELMSQNAAYRRVVEAEVGCRADSE